MDDDSTQYSNAVTHLADIAAIHTAADSPTGPMLSTNLAIRRAAPSATLQATSLRINPIVADSTSPSKRRVATPAGPAAAHFPNPIGLKFLLQ